MRETDGGVYRAKGRYAMRRTANEDEHDLANAALSTAGGGLLLQRLEATPSVSPTGFARLPVGRNFCRPIRADETYVCLRRMGQRGCKHWPKKPLN